ncbi:hypothetical protein PHIM7_76 [Sinorhizobium phage phiM7]|uniref:Uncharacterized protein n=3 Tax=Emdodecavirus TaxID=1980937 RepID=S5MPH5_9CAUD|nr:hypothetical protein AB690_gp081 [Sinorhizobium phage phiM12]YP_009212332.1 hypothetical protein AVT40_gp092 [Sinorhizobium phage phiN3]YP_009601201.1 hypothetical protein FDH46_gp076 [Sinorhizobium phage phiM7]AKF12984.1 hypothetical protein PHIM19_77 [Sinorhizobium phage phiM19]AGR47730.1 hypothetical protein SmphiM12_098 [Sinorhizobium phage phiM12]AKF12624.1 hypothetical protein PHIM7_76 [Sinorhizobium phage phiM7]AKF13356.1 hypothetical protein PHIN3_92 [Sinorhizobium phage phiN3]
MSVVVVVENPTPSVVMLSSESSSFVETATETYVISVMGSDEVSFITAHEQGPAGPANDPVNVDLSLLFENALI